MAIFTLEEARRSYPILSPMLAYDNVVLINTIIHAMLHQTVWITGSVSCNESLANFVGEHGTLTYLAQRYFAQAVTAYPEVFWRMKTTAYRTFLARQPLNNAVLLAFRVYHHDPTFFEQVLAAQGGDRRRMMAPFKILRAEQTPAHFHTR